MEISDVTSIFEFLMHFRDEVTVIKTMMAEGFLPSGHKCYKCNKDMILRRRGESMEWRCRGTRNKDCSSRSLKAGTWFTKASLPLRNTIALLIMWVDKHTTSEIAAVLNISVVTIIHYKNLFRNISIEIDKSYEPIGGEDHVVEIEEWEVQGKGGGGGNNENWAIGGIDRTTRRCFALMLTSRTASTVLPLLKERVHPRSRISSKVKSYAGVFMLLFGHTDNGELEEEEESPTSDQWHQLKSPIKASNATIHSLRGHLAETVVRLNELGELRTTMYRFIKDFTRNNANPATTTVQRS